MLDLSIEIQGLRLQVRVKIGAAYPLEELFPVGVPLPRHPGSIGLRRVVPKRATSMISHDQHLGYIGAEAHVV